MATAEVVRVDYETLEQVASRFRLQSQTAARMSENVRRAYVRLQGESWIGRGADAFVREMDGEILPALRRLIDALAEAAQVTRAILQHFEQADQQASRPFHQGDDTSLLPPVQEGPLYDSLLNNSNGAAPDGGVSEDEGTIRTPDGEIPIRSPSFPIDQLFPWLTPAPEHSYIVPGDWLSGVEDSLHEFIQDHAADFDIPKDWLDNVTAPLVDSEPLGEGPSSQHLQEEQESGGGSGNGSAGESGGGSDQGSGGSENESPQSAPTWDTEQSGGGGSSGGAGSGGMGSTLPESQFQDGWPFDRNLGNDGGSGIGFPTYQPGDVFKGPSTDGAASANANFAPARLHFVGASGGAPAGAGQHNFNRVTFAPQVEAQVGGEGSDSGWLPAFVAGVLATSPFLAALAVRASRRGNNP